MRYKYYFFSTYRSPLKEWLEEKKIRYKIVEGVGRDFVCFSIWSDMEQVNEMLAELKKMPQVLDPHVSLEFSAVEMAQAKLFEVRSKKQCVDITNHLEAYSYTCKYKNAFGNIRARHKEQTGLLAIAKEPSSKTQTAIWCPDTAGYEELFVDQRIVDLVRENQLNGIEFKNVKLKNGSFSERIFQMVPTDRIGRDCISTGHGEKVSTCPVCGKEQYFISDANQLHLYFDKLPEDCDLYMTERIFGEEGLGFPIYVMSQRFYQLLKKNKLAGSMIFTPVVEID